MIRIAFRRCRLAGVVSGAVLFFTACSAMNGVPNAPPDNGPASAARQRDGGQYKTIYTFHGSDGQLPMSTLLNVQGTFYGTTNLGGSSNEGTLFSVTPKGKEETFYSFGTRNDDGSAPETALIQLDGTLFGTTSAGGKYDGGTIFSMTASGKESILHDFGAKHDGSLPNALTAWNGTFYGTTVKGGKYGDGTAFSITLDGKETVLHDFGPPATDGAGPGPLLEVNGMFYGTTGAGGKCYENGTVFRMTPTGTVTILYNFDCNYDDGENPIGGLILVHGKLYGVTFLSPSCSGTVFSVTLSGKEKVLHSFCTEQDGKLPFGPLIDVHGTLYGETNEGGANNAGTIFAVTLHGKESIAYSFSAAGPAKPIGGPTYYKGALYGTIAQGGPKNGLGTVFRFVPSGVAHVTLF
jgi:uncharacterized repeat protein (TIGR03803 family)